MENNIFEDLFVLEMANNHSGNVEKGLKIINDFSSLTLSYGIKTGIKLQFRDVENFIHKNFLHRNDIRYINKTLKTKINEKDYAVLVDGIKKSGCIAMATPFDEVSVKTCEKLGIEIIKIASSDINDKILIEEIAKTGKPVIVSTGGASSRDIEDVVNYFDDKKIPLAINHCISIYPSEKNELELNKIAYLKRKYPNHIIGYSTHEYNQDIEKSILIAYAKGARTIERHIDIQYEEEKISPYCSTVADIEKCLKAYKTAKELCEEIPENKAIIREKETRYLNDLVRGVYAKRDLKKGEKLTEDNVYLAIPLQKGQISCRELTKGEVLNTEIKKDMPVKIDEIDSYYAQNEDLKNMIYERGLTV